MRNNKNRIFILCICILFFNSCKTKDKTASTGPIVVTDTPLSQSDENAEVFRVVVTFISTGEGTDQEAPAMLQAFLERFALQHNVHAENTRFAWGKEGEIDNCFTLKNFTPAQQEMFISELRGTFRGSKLVIIEENKKNMFKK